jgi:hypothetical protein
LAAESYAELFHILPALANLGIAIWFSRFIRRMMKAQELYYEARQLEEQARRQLLKSSHNVSFDVKHTTSEEPHL